MCDDYLSSVRTANFDIRSFELNFEANAFIFDEKLNKSLKEDFMNDVKKINTTNPRNIRSKINLREIQRRHKHIACPNTMIRALTGR